MLNRLILRAAGPFVSVVTILLVEGAALAADPPAAAEPKAWETEKPTQRGGFTVGMMAGFGVSSVVGFPNDPLKINRLRYYTETGARPSAAGALWFGGALTDWFTFGVGGGGGFMFATGDQKVTTAGGFFHLEAFPLFPLGGRYRDLGVMFEAGLGLASVDSVKNPDQSLVSGAGCSIIGGGLFYEGIHFWKVHGGPYLAGNYYWADTVRRPGIFLGWRMALYTKPKL